MCPQAAPFLAPILKTVMGTVIAHQVTKALSPKQQQQQTPAPIIPKQNVPYQRPTAPTAASALDTENIRPEDEDIKLSQSKKARKKLERTRRGVKDLAAVDAPSDTPSLGINPAGYA